MGTYNYYLVDDIYYNKSTGTAQTPVGVITYKLWSNKYKVDVAPVTLHKLLVNTDGDPYTRYCGRYWEDTVDNDLLETYFDIVPGTTYPAVSGVDDHGFNNAYFVKIDGTWYKYTDPEYDFDPYFGTDPEEVDDVDDIERLEEVYAEYGETWTDCLCTEKSGTILVIQQTNKSPFTLYIQTGWGASGRTLVLTYSRNTFTITSKCIVYDVSFNDSAIFPTSDEPLDEHHFYKYNNKYYNANGQEVFGIEEISSIDTGRQVCVNNVQTPSYKMNVEGETNYYRFDNYSICGFPTGSSFTRTDGPYKCVYADLNGVGSDNRTDFCFYNDNENKWYYIDDYSHTIEEISNNNDKAYLNTFDLSQISDTVEFGTINYPILSYNNSITSLYSDLGTVSGTVCYNKWNTGGWTYYPLYIVAEAVVKIERPLVTTYTKTQGNLQRNNQPAIKVYNTLALANADILNIAANETVLIKDSGMYQKQNNALVAILSKKTLVDPYKVGDLRFVYDRSQVDSDWLLCDGSSFNQNDYPALYTALGNSTTLPNCTDRCLGAAGNLHLLTTSESKMLTHKHLLDWTNFTHNHDVPDSQKNYSHYHPGLRKLTTVNYQYLGYYYTYQNKPNPARGALNTLGPYIYSPYTDAELMDLNSEPYSSSPDSDLHINEASVWVYIKAR